MTHSASERTRSGSRSGNRSTDNLTPPASPARRRPRATDSIRSNPGMYVGGTDARALVTLAIDPLAGALERGASDVTLRIGREFVSIETDREVFPGTPADWLSVPHVRKSGYTERRWRLPHPTLVVLNALSRWLSVGDDLRFHDQQPVRFGSGRPATRLRWQPDSSIFCERDSFGQPISEWLPIDLPAFGRACDDLATVHPGRRVRLVVDADDYAHTFHYPQGVLSRCRAALAQPGVVTAEESVRVEWETAHARIAIRFVQAGPDSFEVCDVPRVRAVSAGSYETAILSGIRTAMSASDGLHWPLPVRAPWTTRTIRHARARLGLQAIVLVDAGDEDVGRGCGLNRLTLPRPMNAAIRSAVARLMREVLEDELFVHQLQSILATRSRTDRWSSASALVEHVLPRSWWDYRPPLDWREREVAERADVEVCLEDLPTTQRILALETALRMVAPVAPLDSAPALRSVRAWSDDPDAPVPEASGDSAGDQLLRVLAAGERAPLPPCVDVVESCADLLVASSDPTTARIIRQTFRERWWELVRCRLAFRDARECELELLG